MLGKYSCTAVSSAVLSGDIQGVVPPSGCSGGYQSIYRTKDILHHCCCYAWWLWVLQTVVVGFTHLLAQLFPPP